MCHLPKFEDPDLLVGFDTSDDAAVYQINDDTAMIQTVDIFPPVVDDPYEYGQVAAANSLSDVYAMGGSPKLALNIFCFPQDLPKDVVQAILQGGYEKVAEAGAVIAGGHTIQDKEPKYGLSVTGFVSPDRILRNNGAKPGDLLLATKGVGTGALTTAAKADLLEETQYREMITSMASLNKGTAEIMSHFPVNSCTDVTGFGLLGHAFEMAAGSKQTIFLNASAVPLLSGAFEMAEMGMIPAGAYKNRDYLSGRVQINSKIPLALEDLLYDPQTSGGLLISLPEKEAIALSKALKDEGELGAIIGWVEDLQHAPICVV